MREPPTTHMKTLAITVATAGLLGVTGCGVIDADSDMGRMQSRMSETSEPTASSTTVQNATDFNHADVMFAEMMYPHHGQAVEMSDMVKGRTDNATLIALATTIRSTQTAEMDQMYLWLMSWGAPPPHVDSDGMGVMGRGHGAMNGMMSQEEMDDLANKAGTDFDRLWLTLMIEHHKGGITMAANEVKNGLHPATTAMASTIITTQRVEISQMTTMLQE
ncbi:DUF305 domain-containing protein [Williamsia muralis]|uniref:DUF305 domain-containing protein n=1 Tax=Williamsia marianensis TaxID=85044 RepID=A0ABU4F150_WILMA|nr:DUF305 domain-containing protein [Williamsia muralis]MDV7136602.1 DUF305 domain-containing protein [Williamsia muralis]